METRIAFLVFVHRNASQVARLVGRLRADLPRSEVLVRQDRRTVDMAKSLPFELGGVHLRDDGARSDWGDWSLVVAVMATLEWALGRLAFDWVVCLSGQDYPAQHLRELEEQFATTSYDGFLSCWPVESYPFWSEAVRRRRYHYRWYQLPSEVGPIALSPRRVERYARRAARVVNVFGGAEEWVAVQRYPPGFGPRVGLRRRRTPFSPDFPCWAGRQWWALRRPAAELLASEYRRGDALRRYYRRTAVPDESFFPTVLSNAGVRLGPDLHHQDWTREHPRPYVFRSEDLADIVDSGKPFVRKVDIDVDDRLLDLLDEIAGQPERARG